MKVIVNIDVPQLAPAIAFYTAALGLRLSRTLDDDVAELTGASSVIYLLQNGARSRPVASLPLVRDYARHWTPVHLDFVVDDIAAAARRAAGAGAVQQGDCVEWRGSKCITFADPFGNGFCLIEFAGGTYADAPGDC
jgi:catechol 2,3-dioxygenase-like lactoylglutathione lyase family enzyme